MRARTRAEEKPDAESGDDYTLTASVRTGASHESAAVREKLSHQPLVTRAYQEPVNYKGSEGAWDGIG